MINSPSMIVLGIESTCDDVGVAIVENGERILSNVIHSQIDLHRPFGGVYPELAARSHVDLMIPVVDKAIKKAGIKFEQIDLIVVASQPGLIGSLLIGLNTAKTLSLAWNRPFIGVNHVEAHLYAAMMGGNPKLFPAIGVVLSGGHTFLTRIHGIGHYEIIGSTVDDAIGEAFDKVAAMLGLPYPGGPEIEKLALLGDRTKCSLNGGKVKNQPWSFSFSGLKTSVLYALKGQNLQGNGTPPLPEDIAASFQETALNAVVEKVVAAHREFPSAAIYLGGGVTMNQRLRDLLAEQNLAIPLFWPSRMLCLDNGAMIAGLGYHQFLRKGTGDSLDLEPMTKKHLLRN